MLYNKQPQKKRYLKHQEANMNEYIKQISDRIRELRDILDLTAEEVAANIGVSTEEYLAYENGEKASLHLNLEWYMRPHHRHTECHRKIYKNQ